MRACIDRASKQKCSTESRHPEDRPTKHPSLPAFLPLVRDGRRKDCRPGCANADARNFSIPPCCPGSDLEIRVGDQKRWRGETRRHCVAPGFVMRFQASMKLKPDE